MTYALIIGGGPAGLMAAEMLSAQGHAVVLTEAMPTVGRKFLMAGKSGLNLTRDEPLDPFLAHYSPRGTAVEQAVRAFDSAGIQSWARDLGETLFTGSTGRVFPTGMKASPLLRAWLGRLRTQGVDLRTRWRWTGEPWQFDTPEGPQSLDPGAVILALGGASWPRLGSDGQWARALAARGIPTTPFAPSNMGVQIAWSAHMQPFLGQPVKSIALQAGDITSRGEVVLAQTGLEGGGIYGLSAPLRAGQTLWLDVLPDLTEDTIARRLAGTRAKDSLRNRLRKGLGLSPVKTALFFELSADRDPTSLKRLPVPYHDVMPLARAISSVGGVDQSAVDDALMLRDWPGVFAAGEMLDWDAPTGGYLLTACLATGRWAAQGAVRWMDRAAAR